MQKILGITALCISLLWVFILFSGLPEFMSDPDGVLGVITLVLLDVLLAGIGGLSALCAFRSGTPSWTALSVLAIPLMHALGSVSEPPVNLICFIFHVALLLVMILIKWNSSIADG